MPDRKLPDEIIGPFTVRVRTEKMGPRAIAIEGDSVAQSFSGYPSEIEALEAARVWASDQAVSRRVARKRAHQRTASKMRRSLDELKQRFLQQYPQGFSDPAFLGEERTYKLEAKGRLDGIASLDRALSATEDERRRIKNVFNTNMLSRFENSRAGEVLTSPDGPAFLRGCAQLARGDIEAGLQNVRDAITPYGRPSWPIATFLPFLWDPDRNMFLKTEATKRVAGWLGDDFTAHYSAQLEPTTYVAFQAFGRSLFSQLAEMGPRDLIDVQSFVWVVANKE